MEADSVNNYEEQAAESLETADKCTGCPLTRQEAVKSLLVELEQNENLIIKFLKLIEYRIFSLSIPVKMFKSSDETLEAYHCMRERLKMLRNLFNYMKRTAGQL